MRVRALWPALQRGAFNLRPLLPVQIPVRAFSSDSNRVAPTFLREWRQHCADTAVSPQQTLSVLQRLGGDALMCEHVMHAYFSSPHRVDTNPLAVTLLYQAAVAVCESAHVPVIANRLHVLFMQHGLQPTADTFLPLFRCCESSGEAALADQLMLDMSDRRIAASAPILHCMIRLLSAHSWWLRRVPALLERLESIESERLPLSVHAPCLMALAQSAQPQRAFQLYDKLRATSPIDEQEIDSARCDALLTACVVGRDQQRAAQIRQAMERCSVQISSLARVRLAELDALANLPVEQVLSNARHLHPQHVLDGSVLSALLVLYRQRRAHDAVAQLENLHGSMPQDGRLARTMLEQYAQRGDLPAILKHFRSLVDAMTRAGADESSDESFGVKALRHDAIDKLYRVATKTMVADGAYLECVSVLETLDDGYGNTEHDGSDRGPLRANFSATVTRHLLHLRQARASTSSPFQLRARQDSPQRPSKDWVPRGKRRRDATSNFIAGNASRESRPDTRAVLIESTQTYVSPATALAAIWNGASASASNSSGSITAELASLLMLDDNAFTPVAKARAAELHRRLFLLDCVYHSDIEGACALIRACARWPTRLPPLSAVAIAATIDAFHCPETARKVTQSTGAPAAVRLLQEALAVYSQRVSFSDVTLSEAGRMLPSDSIPSTVASPALTIRPVGDWSKTVLQEHPSLLPATALARVLPVSLWSSAPLMSLGLGLPVSVAIECLLRQPASIPAAALLFQAILSESEWLNAASGLQHRLYASLLSETLGRADESQVLQHFFATQSAATSAEGHHVDSMRTFLRSHQKLPQSQDDLLNFDRFKSVSTLKGVLTQPQLSRMSFNLSAVRTGAFNALLMYILSQPQHDLSAAVTVTRLMLASGARPPMNTSNTLLRVCWEAKQPAAAEAIAAKLVQAGWLEPQQVIELQIVQAALGGHRAIALQYAQRAQQLQGIHLQSHTFFQLGQACHTGNDLSLLLQCLSIMFPANAQSTQPHLVAAETAAAPNAVDLSTLAASLHSAVAPSSQTSALVHESLLGYLQAAVYAEKLSSIKRCWPLMSALRVPVPVKYLIALLPNCVQDGAPRVGRQLLHAMRSRDEATSSIAATEAAESRQAACALLSYMFALGVGCPAEAAAAYQRARRLMLNGSRVSCALLRERERVHATESPRLARPLRWHVFIEAPAADGATDFGAAADELIAAAQAASLALGDELTETAPVRPQDSSTAIIPQLPLPLLLGLPDPAPLIDLCMHTRHSKVWNEEWLLHLRAALPALRYPVRACSDFVRYCVHFRCTDILMEFLADLPLGAGGLSLIDAARVWGRAMAACVATEQRELAQRLMQLAGSRKVPMNEELPRLHQRTRDILANKQRPVADVTWPAPPSLDTVYSDGASEEWKGVDEQVAARLASKVML